MIIRLMAKEPRMDVNAASVMFICGLVYFPSAMNSGGGQTQVE
jgi:hypothetical protein